MKKGLLMVALTTLSLCTNLCAQEFWILPTRTHVLVGQRVPLQLTVGENFSGDRWECKGKTIRMYNHYSRSGSNELLLSLEPGEGLVHLPDFIPATEGTHVLTIATKDAFLETEEGDFNDYLKDEGLMTAYEYRLANNERFENGKEKFRRCTKVIIQAGDQTDNTYKTNCKLLLEIIPDKNPYNHTRSDGLTFKVLYEGTPLPDAMVKWWHKDGDIIEKDFLYTDNRGEVTFSAAKPGLYMISLVHMIHLENDRTADWKSVWSSLVFGIEE